MLQKIKLFINTTRFKTTLWYSFIFFLLELLLGGLIYYQLYNTLIKNLDVSLTKQATAIMRIVSEKKVDFDEFVPDSIYNAPEDLVWDEIFDEVAFDRRNNYIQINLRNKIIFKSASLYEHKLSFPDKTDEYNIFDFRDSTLSKRAIRAVQLNNSRYKVVVAFPKEHIIETLGSVAESYKILAPLFLIISIIGGALISQKSLSRIDAIIKKTEEITAQNMYERIEGEEFNDEYGRLVRKMNEMIRRIKVSIDYMNQFSISAAHELKTPLTILRGETELALKSKKTPEQYVEVINSCYEETLRLIKIVDNLFFISKIDNNLVSLKKTEIDIDDFLFHLGQNFKTLGQEKNIRIIVNSTTHCYVLIDRELMIQAFSNLIDNALKYGEENKSVIIISEIWNDDKVKVTILNYGDGIPNESIPKIFDRFYRVESSRSRKTGGVGLGLSVVKAICEWHDADLTVTSVPGKETKFSVILPII
ncbi:MAG: ATP-binding protein [Ignavibacteriaceae bacterium]|nr:ATP-binding protein [Ignavibacteriaceae bacterium]